MFSLSGVNKRRRFFECLCTLWALFSGSNTDTTSAVFLEECLGSWFCKKNFFFFLRPLVRSRQPWREISASVQTVLRTVPTLLGKYLLFGKLNNNLQDTWKKVFLCKCCRMSKRLWNFLWKKKLLHRTQQFSFQNSFTICCSFFVVFSPTLKKTRLFCFGNLAQNRPWDASWITPQHPSISKTMLFFFSSKTVFLYRKKKNSRILFVQETAVPLQMKLRAKWRLRKKKQNL